MGCLGSVGLGPGGASRRPSDIVPAIRELCLSLTGLIPPNLARTRGVEPSIGSPVRSRQAGLLGLEIGLTLGWCDHLLTNAPAPHILPAHRCSVLAAMSGNLEPKPDSDSAAAPKMPCASCSCLSSEGSFSPRAIQPSSIQGPLWDSTPVPALERGPRGQRAWGGQTRPLRFICF